MKLTHEQKMAKLREISGVEPVVVLKLVKDENGRNGFTYEGVMLPSTKWPKDEDNEAK